MSKSRTEQDQERKDREYAFARVRDVLASASRTETDQPILHMITVYRKSATIAVRVFVIMLPSVTCVDITSEVATILGKRYSQAHRGMFISGVGVNLHHHVTHSLAHALYGFEVREPLHYRSV